MSTPPLRPSRPDFFPFSRPGRTRCRAAPVIAFLFVLCGLWARPAAAQETDPPALPLPTNAAPADTVVTLPADTLGAPLPADTIAVALPDAAAPAPSRLKEPVKFTARDSLVLSLGGAADRGTLFGDSKVTYGAATLDAYRVDILFDRDELQAVGLPVDTGMVGRPSFAQGSETFQGTSLAFNLRTERGRVVGAQTAIEDGFIRAGVVKVAQDSTLYIAEGAYTTCECGPNETPSYTLRSSKMKIVDGEWIYTGPIRLYLFDIPTPLWLPFGFLPAKEGRRSGPLPPQYGEDERGFYLREWGWYQAISAYMDAQIQFGFWSKGSWEINPLFRYARRYHYTGQLEVDYVRNRRGEVGDPDLQVFSTSSLRWSHNQTIDPSTSFTSNVNLSTQNYLKTVSDQYEDRVRPTIQSGINFNKQWRSTGRSVTLNLSQRQVLASGQTDLTLPTLSFSQGSRKPFARETRPPGQGERWYEKITYSYSSNLSNTFAYNPVDSLKDEYPWYEVLFSPDKYRRASRSSSVDSGTPFTFKAAHRINSGASFTMNRLPFTGTPFILNLSPSLNYTEDWFVRTNRKQYVADTTIASGQRLVTESVADWLALRQFSLNASANTTIYGLFPLRVGAFQGLRHTVRPTLGFTYRPDFYDDAWGYTDSYYDPKEQEEIVYPIVSGVQSPGRQQSVNLSISNVFETKRVEADTTGATQGRTLQLLNLDFTSSYNFAADSMKLAPVSMSARTRLFDRFDLRTTASFSPYTTATDSLGATREVNRYLLAGPGVRVARLTRFDVNVSTAFQSSRTSASRSAATEPRAEYQAQNAGLGAPGLLGGDPFYDPAGGADPFGPRYGAGGYADFAIPWSLRLDFNYGFTESLFSNRTRPRANLNTSFDFNLTPNWKVQGRSGYDFTEGELVMTQLTLFRDLDCWEMSFSWIPFGPYQSYSFDLHVKSGHLRDLLRLRQPRSDVQGRFGGL